MTTKKKKKPNPKTISFKSAGGSLRGPKQRRPKPCPFLGQDPAPQLHKAFPVQQLLFSPSATFVSPTFVSPSVSLTIAITFQPTANRSSLFNWPQTHGLPLQPQMSFLWQQQPDLPSAEEKTNREEKRTKCFEQI